MWEGFARKTENRTPKMIAQGLNSIRSLTTLRNVDDRRRLRQLCRFSQNAKAKNPTMVARCLKFIRSFRKLLRENAKKIEKKTAKTETDEIIRTPSETPKMVKTVIQVSGPKRRRW